MKTAQELSVVSYKKSVTINLGDYENEKHEFSISMPCEPAEIDQTTKYLKRKVEAFIDQYLPPLEELPKKKRR